MKNGSKRGTAFFIARKEILTGKKFQLFIASSIFFTLSGLFFHRLLVSGSIFAERDLAPFFIPPRFLWVKNVLDLNFPFWNPCQYSGIPLFATLQPGVLYPPHAFYLLFPFHTVWNWLIISHFAFCGVSLYIFLKYQRASFFAALTGGVVMLLSGYLLSVHNLITHLFAVPWFPLVLLFYLKFIDTGRKKNIVYASICIALQLIAGAPEIVLMTLLVLGITAVFPVLSMEHKVDLRYRVRYFLLMVFVFIMLSSVQLIPFLELKSNSIRSSGLSFSEATVWSLAWKDFLQFFLPDVFGYLREYSPQKYFENQSWLKTLYLGLSVLAISLFFFMSRDRRRIYLLVLMGLSLLFALGKYTPLYSLLYHAPPFNSIRYPVKFLFLFFFCVAIMSGFGLDHAIIGARGQDRKTRIISQVIFYTGFFCAIAWGFLYAFNLQVQLYLEKCGIKPDSFNDIWFNLHNLKRLLFFFFIFSIATLGLYRLKGRAVAILAVVCVITVDLFLANYGYYNTLTREQLFIKDHAFVDRMKEGDGMGRYFLTSKTITDLFPPRDINAMAAQYAPLYGLYSIDGIEVMRLSYYEEFLKFLNDSPTVTAAERYMDISGVRYLVTSYKLTANDFKMIESVKTVDRDAYLNEYTGYRGRFFLYSQAIFTSNEGDCMRYVKDERIDLKKTLIICSEKMDKTTNLGITKGGVQLVSYSPNKVVLRYDADSDAFLYLSDTYYPGWRAYVDGKETKIYRANLAFRAIEVPKGKHTVVFKYVPMSFYIGLALTLLGIALCVWLWRRDWKALPVHESGKSQDVPDDEGGAA
ncbi:MAG TPA: YfhO family protein [Syntrophorhabdaceae bacterium]|nr:YfhO family protein [Syntrophorhabdaceae bacterium]